MEALGAVQEALHAAFTASHVSSSIVHTTQSIDHAGYGENCFDSHRVRFEQVYQASNKVHDAPPSCESQDHGRRLNRQRVDRCFLYYV